MLDIRRRELITLLGGAAAWPIAARAQAALPVIGILSGATFESMNAFLAWFYPGLESEGLAENRNFTTQFRWADDKYERLPALASDLVRRRVDLIVALGTTPGAQAAKVATQPSRSFSSWGPIRSKSGWCRAWRVLAEISRAPPTSLLSCWLRTCR